MAPIPDVQHGLGEMGPRVVELHQFGHSTNERSVCCHASANGGGEKRDDALGTGVTLQSITLGDDAGQNHPRVAVEKEGDPWSEGLRLAGELPLKIDVRFGVVEDHSVESACARAPEVEPMESGECPCEADSRDCGIDSVKSRTNCRYQGLVDAVGGQCLQARFRLPFA